MKKLFSSIVDSGEVYSGLDARPNNFFCEQGQRLDTANRGSELPEGQSFEAACVQHESCHPAIHAAREPDADEFAVVAEHFGVLRCEWKIVTALLTGDQLVSVVSNSSA